MSNGNITLAQARKLLEGKPTEEQLSFIYQAVINQSHMCGKRQKECDKRYVLRSWFRAKVAFVSGIGATVSVLGVGGVLKFLGVI